MLSNNLLFLLIVYFVLDQSAGQSRKYLKNLKPKSIFYIYRVLKKCGTRILFIYHKANDHKMPNCLAVHPKTLNRKKNLLNDNKLGQASKER